MLAASFAAVAAGVVLGALFVVAGIAKVAAGPRWHAQSARLGTPRSVAFALPWVEIAVGACVAARVAAPWTAVVALVLLAAFTVLIVRHLAANDHPPCACFGAWSSTPLSWWHAARNAGLMALAVIAIVA